MLFHNCTDFLSKPNNLCSDGRSLLKKLDIAANKLCKVGCNKCNYSCATRDFSLVEFFIWRYFSYFTASGDNVAKYIGKKTVM